MDISSPGSIEQFNRQVKGQAVAESNVNISTAPKDTYVRQSNSGAQAAAQSGYQSGYRDSNPFSPSPAGNNANFILDNNAEPVTVGMNYNNKGGYVSGPAYNEIWSSDTFISSHTHSHWFMKWLQILDVLILFKIDEYEQK